MNPNNGGVQRVSDTLAKYFASKNHRLYYLTFQFDENDKYIFPAIGYRLPDPDFFSDANTQYYRNLLIELSIDIVINHDAANDRSKLFLSTGKSPVKKFSLYHTDPLHELHQPLNLSGRINNPLIRKLVIKYFSGIIKHLRTYKKKKEIGFLLENSDRLILLSNEYKSKMVEELRISSTKIEAINNPCMSFDVSGNSVKKKRILFVARIELSVKRPDKMLEIWSNLHQKFPDWELLFLGDGPDRSRVEEMALNMQLSRVKFEGFVDPVDYYKEASIICMTSDYEGFPSVLIEAMQFGIAPITFNNWASLKDVIKNEATGILVEKDNIPEYILKLDHLMANENFRDRIAENAKEYVKKFDVATIGPKWTKLFEEVYL